MIVTTSLRKRKERKEIKQKKRKESLKVIFEFLSFFTVRVKKWDDIIQVPHRDRPAKKGTNRSKIPSYVLTLPESLAYVKEADEKKKKNTEKKEEKEKVVKAVLAQKAKCDRLVTRMKKGGDF